MKDHPPEQTNFAKESRPQHRPYWKRAHRDWKVWVAVVLIMLAMVIYIQTQDLSVQPGGPTQHRVP